MVFFLAGCGPSAKPPIDAQLRLVGQHAGRVGAVGFSPDGKWLASGGDDRTVRIWEAASGAAQRTLEGHAQRVVAVVFSPDGKVLASQSADLTVKLWDVETGTLKQTLAGGTGQQSGLAFSQDGKTLAVMSGTPAGSGEVWLWELTEPPQLRKLAHAGRLTALDFSRDGRSLAAGARAVSSASESSAPAAELYLWELASGKEKWKSKAHEQSDVRGVYFLPDSQTILSAGQTITGTNRFNEFKFWDASTGQLKMTKSRASERLPDAVTADRKTFAAFEIPEAIWIVDLANLAEAPGSDGATAPSKSAPFRLQLASDWDRKEGTMKTWVVSMAFSPNGTQLAGGCVDGCIRVWQWTE